MSDYVCVVVLGSVGGLCLSGRQLASVDVTVDMEQLG